MSYLSWTTKWSSVILMDEALLPNDFEATINFDPNDDDVVKQEIAFERIKFITNGVMANSLLAHIDNPKAAKLHKDFKSMVVTLPGEPGDQLLGYVLLAKLNSVLEHVAQVESIIISSRLGDNIRNLADAEDIPHMEWLHDCRVRQLTGEQPWWHRTDAGCSDIIYASKKKVTVIKDKMDWEELDLGWEPREKIIEVDREPAQIIKFPGWKPQVIQGGK